MMPRVNKESSPITPKKNKTNKNTETVQKNSPTITSSPAKTSPKKTIRKCKRKCTYKFNINKIIKDREAEKKFYENFAVLREEMTIVENDSFEDEFNLFETPKEIKFGYIIFDHTKYNLLFKADDTTNLNLQKLYQMSVEQNECNAVILFNNLMNADWSPVFDDIQNVFYNWGADADTLLNKPVLQKIEEEGKIGLHNFKFTMNYISHCIDNNNKLSRSELLTLAKFMVTIIFDSYYGEMIDGIQKVFNGCIEKALSADDDSSIIAYAEELYSKYTEDELMEKVVFIFSPLEGQLRKMYCYLLYKLFKSCIKSTNTDPFPTTINDWFVQDLVPREYFKTDKKRLECIIKLLKLVVFSFKLFENEEKLEEMGAFLRFSGKSVGLNIKYCNIIQQWEIKLLHLKFKCKNLMLTT